MSGVNWKIEKDLCRCCHAEGSFINLGMPCEDHAETYSDMLKNCLDINVIPVEGVLCELTYTICEACVLRLRDASNFKRQVLMLEERFKEMYSNNFIKAFSGVKEELPDTYPDAFKEEEDYSPHMDDDGFDLMQFTDDGDNGINVKIEKKGKGKAKPKAVPKKKVTKKKVARRPQAQSTEDGNDEGADEGEEVKKTDGKERDSKKRDPKDNVSKTQNKTEVSCMFCDKKWQSNISLKNHIGKYHKIIKCPDCSETMKHRMLLKHRHEEHGFPVPTCGICGYKNLKEYNVLKHQRQVHLKEKNFKCNQCDLEFFNNSKLKKHQIKHSSEKRFECTYCHKKFTWKHNLDYHERIHTGDKKKVCTICDERFVQKASLNYHMARHHPGVSF